MQSIRLCSYLVLILLSQSFAQSASDCVCDFSKWKSGLEELFGCSTSNNAERVFCFVHSIVSFNLKLKEHLTEFRSCVGFWMQLPRTARCRQSCKCTRKSACCRAEALTDFNIGWRMIQPHTKEVFTRINTIHRLKGFSNHLSSIILFSGVLVEVIQKLTNGTIKEFKSDKKFYISAYENKVTAKARQIVNYTLKADNASQPIVVSMADYYHCDTSKMVPFYLGVYGAVLLKLVMRELYEELQGDKIHIDQQLQASHQLYTRLVKSMVQQVIFCNTKEMYSTRTEEIKEKDMALRNVGIVFSSFLLLLAIIIALMVTLSCKNRATVPRITVTNEPTTSGQAQLDDGDLLYKRYYETDETL